MNPIPQDLLSIYESAKRDGDAMVEWSSAFVANLIERIAVVERNIREKEREPIPIEEKLYNAIKECRDHFECDIPHSPRQKARRPSAMTRGLIEMSWHYKFFAESVDQIKVGIDAHVGLIDNDFVCSLTTKMHQAIGSLRNSEGIGWIVESFGHIGGWDGCNFTFKVEPINTTRSPTSPY